MITTRIISTGACVPEQVITNDDLSKIVDTSDEWITQRTGIKRRHISAGENTSYFAINTARQVLERAEVSAEDVDLIIVASVTADYGTPSLACMVQKEIGAVNAVAFDVNAACSGFMFALSIADKYIKTGMYENAIVIGAETLSKIVDWKDRSTCVLFGDGSGGAYVEKSEDEGILKEELGAKGELWDILTQGYVGCSNAFNEEQLEKDNLWYVNMDGRAVFKFATKAVTKSIERVMESAGVKPEEIKYVVPHQANVRIIEAVAHRMEVPMDKVLVNIEHYGNTSAGTLPLCIWDFEDKLKKGDNIIFTAFGAGFTWGAVYVKWGYDGKKE